MNRSDLVARLAETSKLSERRAEKVVTLILDAMVHALCHNERVEVRHFGRFIIKSYRARAGRNPKTGAQVNVQAKRLPAFKAGKALRERLDAASGAQHRQGVGDDGA